MFMFRPSFLHIILLLPFIMASTKFPEDLEGFGYVFNKDGQLRMIDPNTGEPTDKGFEFNVSNDADYNQKHYEALGDVLTQHVYQLVETSGGLNRLAVPEDGTPEKSTFVFASDDLMTNKDKLLILIHGSGVVRAGQWARSLIINHSLRTGTQLQYIAQAKLLGYAVLVLNTNDNTRLGRPIEGSESPFKHVDYVWRTYVKRAPAKHVAIVAHSYGGACVVDLVSHRLAEFQERVFAVAMTDSVHSSMAIPTEVLKQLSWVSRNWVASDQPLDDDYKFSQGRGIQCVSAGHSKHEMTSAASIDSVFTFIEERYQSVTQKQEL